MIDRRAILCVVALCCGASRGFATEPGDFLGCFASATRGELRIPKSVQRRAAGFRYVFIGGFLGDRMGGYFAQNVRELRARGVPRSAIHVVLPDSDHTVDEHRGLIDDEFRKILDAGPERLVVIAHSRGACNALAYELDHPDVVNDRFEALFLVQGPFGGTGIADYLLGEGESMDGEMPPGHRVLAHLLGRLEKALIDRGRHGGVADLTIESSRAYWRRTLAEHAGAIPVVNSKVFYIESRVEPSRLRLFQRAAAWYVRTYYGPSDGVVAAGDQTLAGIGVSLGVVDAGHADLTRRFPNTRAGRQTRKALVQSIMMMVGRAPSIATGSPQMR